MSSKTGPRAVGTDGNDYMFREKVASQYQISSVNKSRLKWILGIHLLLVIFMMLRLSTGLCVMIGMRPPNMLQRLQLPKAQPWEYWWLLSFTSVIFGFLALPKNRLMLMQQHLLGILTFGLIPVLYAVWDLSDDMMHYWNTRDAPLKFNGFPVIVLWSMFLAIALQIHVFGLYFSAQLIRAWRSRGDKKRA